MRASIVAGLLAAGSAHAFTDSSPFVMFSTADLKVDSAAQLQPEARVLATAKELLGSCPTTKYVVASQPNVHASDLYSPPSCEAHRLRRAAAAAAVHGRFSVSDVVAQASQTSNMTTADFAAHIRSSCSAMGVDADIHELALPALPALPTCQQRSEALSDNDYILGNTVDELVNDYTVVYFSGVTEHAENYEASFASPAQMRIKARVETPVRDAAAVDGRPLFEKYQFFTPGVFMSLLTFGILLSILYVGLSAVASLQVPYGAFDKENGPSAQKKQQ